MIERIRSPRSGRDSSTSFEDNFITTVGHREERGKEREKVRDGTENDQEASSSAQAGALRRKTGFGERPLP